MDSSLRSTLSAPTLPTTKPDLTPRSPVLRNASISIDSSSLGECRLEGWLMKQGEKGVVKGWKRRWFILIGYRLFYYAQKPNSIKNKITAKPEKGFIDLNMLSKIIVSKQPYRFELHTPVRVWILNAERSADRDLWVSGLNNFLTDNRIVCTHLVE
eukprot:TRINITY_DN1035_c0_g1_i1.p1 TRINITY_DN1035_c0_g1~~TRINITY_DN1035_c0_g1_i1.p1  ORF type:complete len:156 (+),score=18.15 TRINITY_DN1035_c0_g1_i1:239-706(+)